MTYPLERPCKRNTKNISSSKDYKGVGPYTVLYPMPIIVEYIKKNLDITKPRYSEQISGTANDCFL